MRAGGSDRPLECVAALVVGDDGMILAEERALTKKVMPGALALPGGHVEPGETTEDALRRELEEELGIAPLDARYVCTLLHRSQEFRKLHYFAVTRWEGDIENHEAAALRWLPLAAPRGLDLVDRLAVGEYLRVYRAAVTISALEPFVPAGKDFAAARRFFLDLGFAVNWQAEGYAELQLGAAVFILQDFDNPTVQENLMLLVKVDDLDAWWDHLRTSGVLERYPGVRAKEPTVYPWGSREIHLIDPAGVCWHFA